MHAVDAGRTPDQRQSRCGRLFEVQRSDQLGAAGRDGVKHAIPTLEAAHGGLQRTGVVSRSCERSADGRRAEQQHEQDDPGPQVPRVQRPAGDRDDDNDESGIGDSHLAGPMRSDFERGA
jgi:hypothetical protein